MQYIHRAIDSSLRQTHRNVEVLVIDDGSTDDTLSIAQSYLEKDSRIRVFTQENCGVSSARNHGIREAVGEYLVFLDSDDWLEDDAVEILLDEQIKHPDSLISANFYLVEADGSSREKANDVAISSRPLSVLEVAENFSSYGSYGIKGFNSACFKIFRLSVIKKYHIHFMEDILQAEDTLFAFTYLSRTEKLFYTSKAVLNVFLRHGSATRSSFSIINAYSKVKAHDEMIACPGLTPEVKYALETAKSFDMHYQLIAAFRDGAAYDEIKYIRDNITHRYECLPCIRPIKRLLFLCGLYMPVFVAKKIFSALYFVKRIITPSRP